ncbi:MAG: flagellar export chaperone FlgN [Planctomycetota bacterium]
MNAQPTQPQAAAPLPTLDAQATAALEQLLGAMHERQERLLELALEHREAISGADAGRLGEIVTRTRTLLEEVASLDAERCRLLGVGAPRMGASRNAGDDTAGVKLTDLARRAPEPARSRLVERAGSLRALMERVRAEHASLRAASESMVQHMRGLMQQVAASMSHAKTYSAAGRVECAGSPVVTGIDVSS